MSISHNATVPAVSGGGVGSEFKLLIHSNTTDGSQVFTDSSPGNLTVTANGNIQHDTAESKFNASSVLFDGSGDYLSVPVPPVSGDWTIDFWVKAGASGNVFSLSWGTGGGSASAQFSIACGRTGGLFGAIDGAYNFKSLGTFATGVFVHVAFVQSGTSLLIFKDGVLNQTITNTTIVAESANFTFGLGYAQSTLGWADEIAIRDEAVWTSNFTPPTAPYGS